MAWFIAPYKRDSPPLGLPHVARRYCAVRDFAEQIQADGGTWRAVEILGDRAIVKVKASAATLSAIAADPTIIRVPKDLLNDALSTLTAGQRNAIKTVILDCGYSLTEVNAAFPNLASKTVGDVLRFMASRRQKPRYERQTDTIFLDGPVQACESVDQLDGMVA